MPHLHHGAMGPAGTVWLTLIIVLAALVYLRGWLHLRSTSSNLISGWRAASFVIGLFLIWVAVASPVAALDMELLTAHMVQHLLLMTLAPPLIWLGEPVRLLSQGLPQTFVHTVRSAVPMAAGPATWKRAHAACFLLARWHRGFGRMASPGDVCSRDAICRVAHG